jgi:2'-5' RNA ligase
MRLFTGIALAPPVVDKLSAVLDQMRPTARINWSPAGNLHITSKFIGEWKEDRLGELQSALAAIRVAGPIPITVAQFGYFPNERHPHSFFAGVQAGPGLEELAATIDQALAPLGCARENRPYRPHVTLARIKPNSDIRGLQSHIEGMKDFGFGRWDAGSFHLYLSKPGSRGSVYTILATYDLMREKKTTS